MSKLNTYSFIAIATEISTIKSMIAARFRASENLSHLQYRILVILETSDLGCTATQLSERFDFPLQTVISALDSLARRRAIKRTKDGVDKRSSKARITPAGKALLARADRILNGFMDSLWNALTYQQSQLVYWGSVKASSSRGIIRAKGGVLDSNLAYYEGAIISTMAANKTLSPQGIVLDEFRVLVLCMIAEAGGLGSGQACSSFTRIGNELMLQSSTLHRLVCGLAQKGLLRIEPATYDKRARLLKPTAEGRRLVEQCSPTVLSSLKSDSVYMNSKDFADFAEIAIAINEVLRGFFRYH